MWGGERPDRLRGRSGRIASGNIGECGAVGRGEGSCVVLRRGAKEVTEVTCRMFLERYSDLADGLLGPGEEAAMRGHMVVCGSCRRYDRVVRRGVAVLREKAPEPSRAFHARLQHRLALEGALASRAAGPYPPHVGGWSA